MNLFFVFAGGVLGAVSRVFLSNFSELYFFALPITTILINCLGCFLFGFLVRWIENFYASEKKKNLALLFFRNGFLGSFTTFSTFIFEGFSLQNQGNFDLFLYLMLSVLSGIFFLLAGEKLAGSDFFHKSASP